MPIMQKIRNLFSAGGENRKKLKHLTCNKPEWDPNEFWDIVGELGDGAFGKVYKAVSKMNRTEAALKQVDIKDDSELEECSIEIEILSLCKHKNIVSLHEAHFYDKKLWMFIEFCGGGALDSIMMDLEKPLTEPQIQYLCRQICEGLDFLHQNFVIHRDLKAGNVLLTSDGQVKVADFGVSAKNSSLRQTRDTFIGTPYWMAPEVILCETIKDVPYTFKVDIWSLGITLIEFAETHPPNHHLHPMRVLIKISKSPPPALHSPAKWSPIFQDFVSKCLVKDPDSRLTASELLEHPFIKNVMSNEPIITLLNEVRAEVVFEEKELDDAMEDGLSVVINDDECSSDAQSTSNSESPAQFATIAEVDEPIVTGSKSSLQDLSSGIIRQPVAEKITAASLEIVKPEELSPAADVIVESDDRGLPIKERSSIVKKKKVPTATLR